MKNKPDGPPPEPYWTVKMIQAHLESAAHIHRRLPEEKVNGYYSLWPEMMQDNWYKYYSSLEAKNRYGPPYAREVDYMEYVMTWLRWPTPHEQRIIWARANRLPWKVLEYDFQSCKATLWKYQNQGLVKIAVRLNTVDPEGYKIKEREIY
jgi:hypothetical protein